MMHSTQSRATVGRTLALGLLLAALVVAPLALAAKPAHAATTFTVNSTSDRSDLDFPGGVFDGSLDGKCFTGSVLVVQGEECTLRAAIQEANKTPGADVINFDIPGTGVNTIAPTSELPAVTGPVTINGYSQPGAQPNTKAVGNDAVLKIMLSGAKTVGADALEIGASGSTVKGLVINQWQGAGVRTDGSGATGNRITGNFIGTDAQGVGGLLGNSRGMYVPEGSNNTIGGATPAARNVVSASQFYGVGVFGDTAMGNRILSNSIFSNVELGIDLLAGGNRGPTANDTGDIDTGPNGLQNKPVLSSAKKVTRTKTVIEGGLNSTPSKTFAVQFFSNPTGTSEGKKLLGQKSVTTDAGGDVSFSFSTKKKVSLGQAITATATGAEGTSEFSAPKQVVRK